MADDAFTVFDHPDKILPADKATKVVLDNFNTGRDRLVRRMRDKWDEWYKSYRSVIEIDDDDIRSNFTVPLIFSHIEAYLPRLVANRPRVEVWGRGPEDARRAALHRANIFYDWDVVDVPSFIVNFVKSAMIYGTAWAKVYHRSESREALVRERVTVPQFNSFGYQVGETQEMQENVREFQVWDNAWVDLLEVDHVYPDPNGKDVDSCRWIIHRRKVSIDSIEAARNANGEPLYDPAVVAKLKKRSAAGNKEFQTGDDSTLSLQQLRISTFREGDDVTIPDVHARNVHLIEQWTDSKVTTVVEEFPDLKPLRNEYHVFRMKPFLHFTPIPDPNSIYGISVAEVLYSMFLEQSTLHSARMDHALQSAHNMMSIIRGSGINPRNLRWRPGGYFWANSHDDIQFHQPPPLQFSLYRESDFLNQQAQRASGASDPFSGIKSSGESTATEAQILAQSSGSRAGLMFMLLGQTLTQMGKLFIRINENMISKERMIRLQPGDPSVIQESMMITPEELAYRGGQELDIKIDIAATEPEGRQFRLQRGINALQVLGSIIQDPNHPVMQSVITQVLEGLGVDSPEMLAQQPVAPPVPGAPGASQGGAVTPGEQLAEAAPAAQAGGIGV